MKKYIFFVFCLFSTVLYAQSIAIPQWSIASGGIGNSASYVNEVSAITTDHSGYVISAGSFAGTIDLDPGGNVVNVTSVNTTHLNAFVAKYDTLHNFIWGFNLYSTDQSLVSDIGTDVSDNIYVAGEFINEMDANPSSTATYLLNAVAAGRDLYVAKYAPDGNFAWAFSIGSSLSLDIMKKMITDSEGNVYITGHINDSADFDPSPAVHKLYATASGGMFLARYDSSGNYVWAFSIDEPSFNQEGQSLAFDGNGNIIVGMVYRGTIDADPSANTASFTAQGIGDALIARYNIATGSYVSAFSIGGGTGGPGISSVIVSSNSLHQLAVSGRFWGNLDFDPGTGTHYLNNTTSDDIFIASYSLTGTLKWCFNIGNNTGTAQPYDMATDISGQIYVMGEAYGSADIDPGISNVPASSFIAVYDSLGNYNYANGFNATSGLYYKGFHLFAPDGFYLGGGFKGLLYLSASDIVFGTANWNAFMVRYAQCLSSVILSHSTSASLCNEDNLLLFVNAIGTNMHYQWYKNGLILNDTLPALFLNHVDSSDAGNYFCIITGLCGADTTLDIVISVHSLPIPFASQVGSSFHTGSYSDYQWYMNGNLISGANNQIYTPAVNGLFFVVVTDSNGCRDTSNMIGLAVGLNETDASITFSVYPNPVKDHLNITLGRIFNNVQAVIYNTEGMEVKNIVMKSSSDPIDVSFLSNGIYTMRIKKPALLQTIRFVKIKE